MSKPIRINNPTIVEAVTEIRFDNKLPSAVMFGMLYQKLSSSFPETETLPIVEMPEEFRNAQQELRYAVHYRLKNDRFLVGVGQRVVAINYLCYDDKYSGWADYQVVIEEVLSKFAELDIIHNVESLGLRYLNLLGAELNIPESLNIDVNIANSSMKSYDSLNLVVNEKNRDVNTMIQVATNATVTFGNVERKGNLVTIELTKKTEVEIGETMSIIADLHEALDEKYFALLKPQFLNELGPVYE